MPRKAQFNSGVEAELARFGVLDRIDAVLEAAAPVTHRFGNRRYHHLIFDVEGQTVLSVHDTRRPTKIPSKAQAGTFIAWDPCDCAEGNCGKCVKGYVKVERRVG